MGLAPKISLRTSISGTFDMTFVLLLDRQAPPRNDVHTWLSDNGYVTWLANDLSHAIEELSDFTVRDRPDVVLLEVAFLAESYDAVSSTLNMSGGSSQIRVLGLVDDKTATERRFANDFEQLRTLIDSGIGCPMGS